MQNFPLGKKLRMGLIVVFFYRVQRACDQVSETSRTQLREEMTLHFDTERSALIAKYEKERNALR